MFATIRRHQKWLWAAIIAVVIPSFVVFFTPDAGLGGGGGQGSFGTLNGRTITRKEYAAAYYETMVFYRFSYGNWPEGKEPDQVGFDLDREARSRLVLLDLLARENIQVSDEATASWIRNAFADRRQAGGFQERYLRFLGEARAKNISEANVEGFAKHQVGIQQLAAVVGSNGRMVTPREAEALYRREHEEFETDAVLFSATNFLAGVTLDPQVISQFYSNRLASYRIPERVQVKYIRFDFTNYLAEAEKEMAKQTNLAQNIDAVYAQQGATYYTDTNGSVLPEDQAKAKIKEQFHQMLLLGAARRQASTFATELFKTNSVDNLEKLAGDKYRVQITEPFSEFEGPRNLKAMNNFTRRAFALTEEEPFAEPIDGEDAVYVIAYHRKLPPEFPSLDSIRPKVVEDYRRFQATQAARMAGISFHQQITNSMAQGKAIAAVLAEANVKAVSLPKFSLSTRDLPKLDERLDFSLLKDVASGLAPGQPSRFYDTRDGGFVLYLRAKTPADPAQVKQELPEFTRAFAQSRQYQAFQDWLGREVSRSGVQPPPKLRGTSTN